MTQTQAQTQTQTQTKPSFFKLFFKGLAIAGVVAFAIFWFGFAGPAMLSARDWFLVAGWYTVTGLISVLTASLIIYKILARELDRSEARCAALKAEALKRN